MAAGEADHALVRVLLGSPNGGRPSVDLANRMPYRSDMDCAALTVTPRYSAVSATVIPAVAHRW